ncbi:MAG: RdgB/HAM1 family non-canonical purine NTP pyrophosphatase [Anaerolineae bacterium]|nr:RdgB/HAM1 family non-canonical purine NTP pyrophosphatase [Anaerolineae bacterium]MDQ7037459.1 RdgB/HAM1 family non-canonical purine NTP pyrophosphatase [Anaerolineae bacterium]
MELLIASQNQGKIREYQRLLADVDFEVLGLADVGLDSLDVEETGTTFAENAILKAKTYAAASGKLTLADDSGLVVDALDGAPGVYSARYGQPDFDDGGRRKYLLEKLTHIANDQRTAHFMCVIAVYDPRTDTTHTVEGRCDGQILEAERDGGKGFGYDALFQPNGYTQSFAELAPEEKNRISHRGNAVKKLPDILKQITG